MGEQPGVLNGNSGIGCKRRQQPLVILVKWHTIMPIEQFDHTNDAPPADHWHSNDGVGNELGAVIETPVPALVGPRVPDGHRLALPDHRAHDAGARGEARAHQIGRAWASDHLEDQFAGVLIHQHQRPGLSLEEFYRLVHNQVQHRLQVQR